MAHEITETDNMLSVREMPWHGLGKVLTDYPTREEAQAIAHPWEPVVEPIFRRVPVITEDGPSVEYREIEGKQAVVRSDNGADLGVTNDSLGIVSNDEMYDIAEAIQGEDSRIRYETAGTLRGGRDVWLLIRLEEPITIKGDPQGDTLAYYAIQNSHDGSGSFRGQAINTRIVCHAKGTPVLHRGNWINVEDHPGVMGVKSEDGLRVSIAGLPVTETVTLDHRYQTPEGWIKARDLVKGETEIAYPVNSTVVERPEDEDFWWLVGQWWADGHLHGTNQVTWTVSNPETEDRVLRILRERGFKGHGSMKIGCRQITFAWPEMREVVEQFYRGEGHGKGAREKVPPFWVECLEHDLQRALVQGYDEGDGSEDKARGGRIISSSSLDGLLALRRMLVRLGVPSLVRQARKKSGRMSIQGREINVKASWSLRIPPNPQGVRIEDGVLYSKVTMVEWAGENEFVPLDCTEDGNVYITHFGESHNCANTAHMADLSAKATGTEIRFRHTKNVKSRIEEAKQALAGWRVNIQEYQMFMEHLTTFEVTDAQREEFIERFAPIPETRQTTERVRTNILNERASLREVFASQTGEGIKNTAYGLVQASIEYSQHYRATRGKDDMARIENRFRRSMLSRDGLTREASKLALAVAGVSA